MAENTQATVSVGDIVFDCPHCNKSLAIDPRGAGLVIACPDCEQQVQVPGLPPEERSAMAAQSQASASAADESVLENSGTDSEERIAALSEALGGSQAKVVRLVESLEEIRERRRFLEKLRSDNMARFEQIGKELGIMQNALDRIVAMLQDARAEQTIEEAG